MNIWLINQYAVAPCQAGITRHYMLARELERLGHRAAVIACSFDHVTRRQTRLRSDEEFRAEIADGVEFVWLRGPSYAGNTAGRMWNMVVFAWRLWRETGLWSLFPPDVIVGSSPTLFAALAAERIACRKRVPFVLEVRDLWPLSLVHLGKVSQSHPVVKVLGRIERHLYRSSEQIITLLPGSFEYLVRCGARADKVHCIPNGADIAEIYPHEVENRGGLVVMFTGTHGLAGGLETLIDAAAILQDEAPDCRVKFRFIGDGPNKHDLIQRGRRKQLRNVEFLPPVPKSKMDSCLREADILIAVLRNNGLYTHGISLNKLYDYMAAGRPIAFGGQGAVGNPVEAAGCGLTFAPEDPRAAAAAILKLADLSSKEREQMGMRGRAYVEKHHDIRALARRFEHVLQLSIRKQAIAETPEAIYEQPGISART